MRQPTLDPTAGQRARAIRAFPTAPRRILDPTDPRCGELLRAAPEDGGARTRRIVDPTNPEWGGLPL
jgi:hypothetical protein